MLQHIFPLITLQPSSLAFTLTLVASWLITAAQAESSLGTDAPAPKVTSQPSKSTGGSGGLSTTAKIVIGVVVSMVGISASMLPMTGRTMVVKRRHCLWSLSRLNCG
jgi:hypothetical protein